MKRKRCSAAALLLAIVLLLSLTVPANATSDYDSVLAAATLARVSDTYDDHTCVPQDISSLWPSYLMDDSKWSQAVNVPGADRETVQSAFFAARENGHGWAVTEIEFLFGASIGNYGWGAGDYGVQVTFTPDANNGVTFFNRWGVNYATLRGTDSAPVYAVIMGQYWNGPTGSCSIGVAVSRVTASDTSDSNIVSKGTYLAYLNPEPGSNYSYRQPLINSPIAYPPGYEGELIPSDPPPARYVAMGDSFSSGQGSRRPYIMGSETDTNKCRRSLVAYPKLLEVDVSLNLGPAGFVACGGATASAITTGGFNGESAQMDVLTGETDLVTLSVIGNDIPFDAFARECAMPGVDRGCVLTGQAYLDAMASIDANVKPRLEQLLQTLDERLTSLSSNARVLVVGYPQILPEAWVYETGCWWLQSDELPAIRSVQDALNAAIYDKVIAKGGRFEFVSATASNSPFAGHELCRESSASSNYFNGVVSGENEDDSFHPNEAGQRAYAQLIKNYLTLHPLG